MKIGQQGIGLRFGNRELEALARLGLVERLQELAHEYRPEALDPGQPPNLGRLPKIVQRAHPELVIKQLDALWPQAGQRRHLADLARQGSLQSVQKLKMASLDDVGDLAGQVLADARQFGEVLPLTQHGPHALRQAIDCPCGPPVGADAKGIVAPELEQVSGLVEQGSNFSILDQHCIQSSTRAKRRP